jgi:uncharacterized protein GlcG (DUF336 family)
LELVLGVGEGKVMGWRHLLRGQWRLWKDGTPQPEKPAPLCFERLEPRMMLNASATLAGGVLFITGQANKERINVFLDPLSQDLVVQDFNVPVGRFSSAAVKSMAISTGDGNAILRIGQNVLQPAIVTLGAGNDVVYAGGGTTEIIGGSGTGKLVGGPAGDVLVGGTGKDTLIGKGGANVLVAGIGPDKLFAGPLDHLANVKPNDRVVTGTSDPGPATACETLSADEVGKLLSRAAAATASDDAIVAIVDREGNILGVRVEGGVSPSITGNDANLVFAIDGAVAEARTGAFFANNQAPLTSRTVQFISQSTITQREVDSNPNIPDPNSTLRGPGLVAPIEIGGHFPPGVMFTPQVDLFEIELSNRDSVVGASRFNINPAFIPAGDSLPPPVSYGVASGLMPNAQSRGIGTLPGGIPIFKNGQVVGGIGVFFPGKTGFASEENSSLSANFNPALPDRSLEAEYIAVAAVGGSSGYGLSIGTLGGVPPLPGFDLPGGPDKQIDLVGITLPLFGPGGRMGPQTLVDFGSHLGIGDKDSMANVPVIPLTAGKCVPDGFLVTPHNGVPTSSGIGLTAQDVTQIIDQGIAQEQSVRAAIRLPLDSRAKMTIAVTDLHGNVIGLYRTPDSTVFSLDIAVAKARNVAYYANPDLLQPVDQVPGVPPGAAFTNRTFRYLALPRFPEGIDGRPPGPFSILNDGGVDPATGLNSGPPLPASAYQSVLGFDAFNPNRNFRDPADIANQNGVVFFPGSVPLYKNGVLVGGLGVSGDGVDQDDVVAFAAAMGFQPPPNLTADNFFFNGVRLPYQKFNRNPLEP